MADEKVLVVDDEVEMVMMLRNYLTREGYEVKTAPSAETALHCLEDQDYDVVLTDLRMRGMDGLGLVREIHATRPETQLILMTAFGGIDIAVEAIKAGAYHFVAKPVKLPEVGALVRKALTERDLRRENRQLRQAVEERYSFGQLLGKSAVIVQGSRHKLFPRTTFSLNQNRTMGRCQALQQGKQALHHGAFPQQLPLAAPHSTKGEKGTGLGLAICKQIIDSHRGTMRLASVPGAGTTVTIVLPQTNAQHGSTRT